MPCRVTHRCTDGTVEEGVWKDDQRVEAKPVGNGVSDLQQPLSRQHQEVAGVRVCVLCVFGCGGGLFRCADRVRHFVVSINSRVLLSSVHGLHLEHGVYLGTVAAGGRGSRGPGEKGAVAVWRSQCAHAAQEPRCAKTHWLMFTAAVARTWSRGRALPGSRSQGKGGSRGP